MSPSEQGGEANFRAQFGLLLQPSLMIAITQSKRIETPRFCGRRHLRRTASLRERLFTTASCWHDVKQRKSKAVEVDQRALDAPACYHGIPRARAEYYDSPHGLREVSKPFAVSSKSRVCRAVEQRRAGRAMCTASRRPVSSLSDREVRGGIPALESRRRATAPAPASPDDRSCSRSPTRSARRCTACCKHAWRLVQHAAAVDAIRDVGGRCERDAVVSSCRHPSTRGASLARW